MVVEQGYKQTEVGVIPEDWEVSSIGCLFDFKNGLNKEKHFFGYGTPIINYMDVFQFSGLTPSSINGKVSLFKSEINAYSVKKGDVFFTRTSETVEEIGITSVLLEESPDTVFSGFILRARDKSNKLDIGFKKYCFNEIAVRKQIISTASYTTRALTNGRLLSQVLIKIPPLTEQTAIANALSDMDALIAQTEKLIEKKKAIKQGVMQELLKPKEGWVTKKFTELISRIATGLNPRNNFRLNIGGENYYVTIKNFKNGKLFLDEKCDRIDDDALHLINYRSDLRKNDILFSSIGRIGDLFLIKERPHNWNINESVFSFRPNINVVYPNFLCYLLQQDSIKAILDNGATGSTFQSIKVNDLRKLEFLTPFDLNEQIDISNLLDDIFNEIEIIETKLQKLKLQKQGMMQALLTGKIRLI